ncbi:MAG: MBL fold metallo-hydrolase [Solirubrobacterales bacterium]
MRARLWGVRGSIPVPGPATKRFGGNTSCAQVTAADGSEFVLDAGTGIRALGAAIAGRRRRLHVLLTHLHLDHIQGLMFFAPFFDPAAEITVWGPPAAGRALRKRLARYISNPLSPIEISELPARVTFRDVPSEPWRLGGVEVRASLVAHRGPTLGYRLSENGSSLCYLPDHEPALGHDLATAQAGWVSGLGLARGASLLIHDCQYSESEYPAHRGWGHSSLPDALAFARRCEARRLVLVHHDPGHDDALLETLALETSDRWTQLGGEGRAEVGREGDAFELAPAAAEDRASSGADTASPVESKMGIYPHGYRALGRPH